MFKKRQQFYIKLLSFVLLLGIIPVSLVGIFSFLISSDSIQTKVEKEKEYNVYQTQMTIEQVLKQVDQSLTNFAMSPLANQLLEEPMEPKQFPLYRSLKKELNYLQRFDSGVIDITYINKEQMWLIRNRGLKRLTNQDKEIIENYSELTNQSAWLVQEAEDTFIDEHANYCKRYLTMVKKLPLSSVNNKGFTAAIIPICDLQERILMEENNGSTIVLNENKQVIFNSEVNQNSHSLENHPVIDAIQESNQIQNQLHIDYDNEKYTVTYRVSNYNGWTYINLIRLNDLKESSYAIGWFTFIICLVIVLGLIIVAIIGSGKLYKPIQQIIQIMKLPHEADNNKSRDEIGEITKQIHTILDKNQTLEERVQSQKDQLHHFFINKLLLGNVTENEINEKLPTEINSGRWYSVMLIKIDSLEGTRFTENDNDVILFSINTIINELISEDRRFTPIVLEDKQVTVLMGEGNKQEYKNYFDSLTQTIQETIAQVLKISVSIGISNRYFHLIETNEALQKSEAALRQTIVLGKGQVIWFDSLEGQHSFKTFYPKQVEHDLFDAIKTYHQERVEQKLTELLDNIFNKQLTYTQYEISILRFINNLLEFTEMLAIEIDMIDEKQTLINYLQRFRIREDIESWFKQVMIYPIMDHIKNRSDQHYHSLSEQVIHIIHEEFDQDLTLEKVADRLHYNASYLSNLFRRETKMSFSEYVAQYRIEMAKNWLETTKIPVKDIANKLQYNNSQNFIRSFRKNVGMTPGNYRKKMKLE
ncbi:helix-turn-helix domain-containing protein [Gracilibacillus salitolerans]|uniref:Helix-turn-helix domain-containing protein n=1 Tax=Gracilibacillus salitolerans TaxID=2663022 RepID=A0A5Q2TGF8_9BACI|nr:AraC family transcriptional regulator [Gracilibacillus salitolerans]QGH33705.1 helix-turn-helix domain-containing protein [Gracilibacillus salitolerans]